MRLHYLVELRATGTHVRFVYVVVERDFFVLENPHIRFSPLRISTALEIMNDTEQ